MQHSKYMEGNNVMLVKECFRVLGKIGAVFSSKLSSIVKTQTHSLWKDSSTPTYKPNGAVLTPRPLGNLFARQLHHLPAF